jgi:hypothetical protein
MSRLLNTASYGRALICPGIQVEVSLQQLEEYGSPLDLKSLQEVQLWSLSTKLHRDFFTGSYSSSQVAYMLDAPQMEYDTL